jgi:hypothetical protein
MKTIGLPAAAPAAPIPARQAFGRLEQAAHSWLERLADMLEGDDVSASAIHDAGEEEVVRLEVTLQSDEVLAVATLLLEVRPNAERDLTEFVLQFHVRRMVGGMAWVPVELPQELSLLAQTRKGGKPAALVAEQLVEQLESASQTEYLLFFEALVA